MVHTYHCHGHKTARDIRKNPTVKPYLSDRDDARNSTVILQDDTPNSVIERVAKRAKESQQDDAGMDGQMQSADRSDRASIGDMFTLAVTRGKQSLQGSSSQMNQLQARHEDRSERAQRVDERRSAKVTRDPVQWTNNPDQFDFPDVDTIQPQELHEERSERAQRVDERKSAPVADSREQWTNNPDQFDWPGVDQPTSDSAGLLGDLGGGNRGNESLFGLDDTNADDEQMGLGLFDGESKGSRLF